MVDTIDWDELFTGPDAHAGRPAADTVGDGALFVCTDDNVIERSDGVSTWTEWFDPLETQ